MAKPQEDRRVRRTRALLQNALMASMIEKGYEATTVQDIIDRADVGRSTFYAHFADKETLLASRLDDLRDSLSHEQQLALAERGETGARGLGFSLPMLEHARSHLPVYTMIVGRESGGFVFQRLHAMIADLAAVGIKTLGLQQTASQRELAVEFIAGAFMSVLRWWADRGAKLEPAEVDVIFRRLVMQGLAAR
jgi:AcrR family transcriptional regulator